MAASDHVNGTQLKMFMTPDELTGGGYVHGSVDQAGGTMDNLMKTKLADAQWRSTYDDSGKRTDSSLHDEVMSRGVEKPVIVTPYEAPSVADSGYNRGGKPGGFVLGNGNHRVASTAEKERVTGRPQFIPVIHDENYMGGKARKHFGIADG